MRIKPFELRSRAFTIGVALVIWTSLSTLFAGTSAPGLGGWMAEAAPKAVWTTCGSDEPIGQRCKGPRGVAANPETGRIFVADQLGQRILEFNARGEFIKTWGWDVVEGGGSSFEICVPENGDICKAGTAGSNAGQFSEIVLGVALDSTGNIYVVDRGFLGSPNVRVQKFSPDGQFLLMFGGEVNKTKVEAGGASEEEENLCPFASSDECQAGTIGAGKGQFGTWAIGSFIAIDTQGTEADADDKVYVGDEERIQVFNSSGHYLEDVAQDPSGQLKDSTVQGLAVDPSHNLYVIYDGRDDVRKLSPGGKELAEPRFKVDAPSAVAVDAAGNVYTFRPPGALGSSERDPIFKFDQQGKLLEAFGIGEYSGTSTGLATNLCPGSEPPGNLYATNLSSTEAFIRAYGTEPNGCFKARTLPADPVEEHAATLNGTVNPKGEAVTDCFFRWGESTDYGEDVPCVPDAGTIGSGSEPVPVHAALGGLERGSVYHFRLIVEVNGETEPGGDEEFKTLGPPVITDEYVVSATDTEATLRGLVNPEGFAASCQIEYGLSEAYGQSTPVEAIAEDRSQHVMQVILKGLSAGTSYHWRISCSNSSGTTKGGDRLVSTFNPPVTEPFCPNEEFRSGPAAFLPDCRAYEMVSPIDKNGGNLLLFNEGTVQAAPDGEKITYNTIPAFGDVQNSFAVNQYLASRRERGQPGEGWSDHGIHPPTAGRPASSEFYPVGIVRDFLGFTPDLCSAWLFDFMSPPFTPEGQKGFTNLYRRDNCEPGEGGLEAVTDVPMPQPQGLENAYVDTESLLGTSEDGSHVVFVARTPLLPDCRTTTTAKTISFQWLRNGAPITGATSPVYTPTTADRGKVIQCQVFTINDNAGSTQVANPPTVISATDPVIKRVPPTAPNSLGPPAQSGALTVGGLGGQTLTCNAGSWGGSPSFTYQWYRNGAVIAEADTSTYVVSAADVATPAVFQCVVTGINADGAVTKVSTHRSTSPAPSPAAPGGNGLTASASAIMDSFVGRIYDRFDGELRLVSVLPGGRVGEFTSEVGGSWSRSVKNAVSQDGSRVYWSFGPFARDPGEGKIFLRQHPEQGIVAEECSEAAKACTVPVSASNEAFFWAAAEDGSKALYSEGVLESASAELFEFNLNPGGAAETRSVAKQVEGVVGASEDLGRIYFVSREQLTGAEQNSEGDVAIEGEPNLYLDGGGALNYVATLSEGDVGQEEPGTGKGSLAYDLVSSQRLLRTSRVSPDGTRLAFLSRAPLTGYDNTDADSGKADTEVFAYKAGGNLLCISCNPSGARPSGRELRKPFWSSSSANHHVFAAAWIPAPEQPLHASNVISRDGGRIFFNANDALLGRDTNGTMDVYQWEAPGVGGCDTEDLRYFAQNGGCIDLISSGESPFEAEFWEASEDGDDVFFTTESTLVPQDPGLVDLYDARVGGGFPQPIRKEPCEGEACQSPPAPPAYDAPASSTYNSSGDPAPESRPCPKGKRKVRRSGKVRCVKKKSRAKGQRKRGPGHERRAER